jgi:glycosyltransferase involved in cell wall biosynthesis
MSNNNSALVAIYAHPEAYPPTLNALGVMADELDEISVLHRPIMESNWPYPSNVRLVPSGPAMHVRVQEQLPLLQKIKLFGTYVRDFRRLIIEQRPKLVLIYDALALFAYSLTRKTPLPKHKVWYHNHDVLKVPEGRLSLNWFASRAEKRIFSKLDFFSLPANERTKFFPMERLKGRYFFLPNLPSVNNYAAVPDPGPPDDEMRLIYQGHVYAGHGFEEIIRLMPFEINGKKVKLLLVGWITDEYKAEIERLAKERGAEDCVEIRGVVPYNELAKLTASCHVGLAVFNFDNIMASTAGTASNKIYEYPACGLPILYFDNPHFRQHLAAFPWAFATDLTPGSLRKVLSEIADNWQETSSAAREDFRRRLNFEATFQSTFQQILLASQ